jgi:hypothetical protein
MMKNLLHHFAILLVCGIFIPNAFSQEKQVQLWLVGEEGVKPEMINQYFETSMELIELCKEENFPYPFSLWTTGDLKYYLWYPIEELNDITRIEEAWDAVTKKYGEEDFRRFEECIEYQKSSVIATRTDLSYIPDSPRITGDEQRYSYWQEFYIKKGMEKDVEALFHEAKALFQDKETNDLYYFGEGRIGEEQPVYFGWSFARDIVDYWEQDKKSRELLGEDLNKINQKLVTCLRRIEEKNCWWLQDLSYSIAE